MILRLKIQLNSAIFYFLAVDSIDLFLYIDQNDFFE